MALVIMSLLQSAAQSAALLTPACREHLQELVMDNSLIAIK